MRSSRMHSRWVRPMNPTKFIEASTLGGPGLDGYMFRGDTYCESCAGSIIHRIAPILAPRIQDVASPEFHDSDCVPQPIFFGEAEYPVTCCTCGAYLYGKKET